jgi:hypothetical protein
MATAIKVSSTIGPMMMAGRIMLRTNWMNSFWVMAQMRLNMANS